jgi:hypothetical protein
MEIKEIKRGKPVFENTREAIEFGENANLEEMKGLFERLSKVFMQEQIFINFNIQVVGEAVHAFNRDEWYEQNR